MINVIISVVIFKIKPDKFKTISEFEKKTEDDKKKIKLIINK